MSSAAPRAASRVSFHRRRRSCGLRPVGASQAGAPCRSRADARLPPYPRGQPRHPAGSRSLACSEPRAPAQEAEVRRAPRSHGVCATGGAGLVADQVHRGDEHHPATPASPCHVSATRPVTSPATRPSLRPGRARTLSPRPDRVISRPCSSPTPREDRGRAPDVPIRMPRAVAVRRPIPRSGDLTPSPFRYPPVRFRRGSHKTFRRSSRARLERPKGAEPTAALDRPRRESRAPHPVATRA